MRESVRVSERLASVRCGRFDFLTPRNFEYCDFVGTYFVLVHLFVSFFCGHKLK